MREVLSTLESLKEFKESIIWKDITEELIEWRDGFKEELLSIPSSIADNPVMSSAHVLTHMGDVNGRIMAIEYVLLIVDTLINDKEIEIENKKGERNE